ACSGRRAASSNTCCCRWCNSWPPTWPRTRTSSTGTWPCTCRTMWLYVPHDVAVG
ncbi:jg24377, partial [Pararge aegeria aegeria]